MAVSGTGKSTDPYKVSSYNELKEVVSGLGSSTDNNILLTKDIDCKAEYGKNFRWTSIETSESNAYTLDLGGHMIKGAVIDTDSYMFFGFPDAFPIIKNGVLKNICNKGALSIMTQVTLENVALSATIDGIQETAFSRIEADSCSFVIVGAKMKNHLFTSAPDFIRCCDFDIKIYANNGYALFKGVGMVNDVISDCRVEAIIDDVTPIVAENCGLISSAKDSVISVECPNSKKGGKVLLFSVDPNIKGTIFDGEKILDSMADIELRYTDAIRCMTADMDASWLSNPPAYVVLNDKGFLVTNTNPNIS